MKMLKMTKMQRRYLTYSRPEEGPCSQVLAAEAVMAVLLDIGMMESSVGSMVASQAEVAMLPVITMLIELLHLVVDGFFHCDSLARHDD